VIIEGNNQLQGTQVQATDLRAAAALVLAGLCASGTTEVTELFHLDRGYVNFVGKLKQLGANIRRINPVKNKNAQKDQVIEVDFTNKDIAVEL